MLMPPNEVKHQGVRVTSTWRAGSQKPIETPIFPKGGGPHMQIGEPTFSISSCPILRIGMLPIVSGNIHDQQISVIGFMNLPVQVALVAAMAGNVAPIRSRAATQVRTHL